MSGPRILQYGVPAPFEFEAPSSWLSRLALTQGCSLEELRVFLELPRYSDLDRSMHGEVLVKLRQKCSLPSTAFGVSGRVMAGFKKTGMSNWSLAYDDNGVPAFRYCPVCLRKRPTAYLDIQWRFIDWRYCPLHNCLMESDCWSCKAPVGYPQDMVLSKAGRGGNASQRRCLRCSADLGAARPCFVNPVTSVALTELEACWLINGRALLASLCFGAAQYRAEGIGTAALCRRAYGEWLPLPPQWSQVERRLRADEDLYNEVQKRAQLRQRHQIRTPWGRVVGLERCCPVDATDRAD